MGKALALDLRRRVVDAYMRGDGTQVEVAARFGVGEASVRRWLRRDEAGRLAFDDTYHHGPERTVDAANLAALREILEGTPDATNAELATLLAERTGIKVSPSTISRAIATLDWTRKKSASSRAKRMPLESTNSANNGASGRRP